MTDITLASLGWSDFFENQLEPTETLLTPARVHEVQRDRIRVLTEQGPLQLFPTEAAGNYAVGDWVLTDGTQALRILEARTALTRKAAGHVAYTQRIAANVDTLGIVSSCNDDFNLARIERYLALAATAGCTPLLILTKADKSEDVAHYAAEARTLSEDLGVLALNAKDAGEAAPLHPYASEGQTLALLGSSGVGKTTLRNRLTGESAATQGIREDDAKGRHTTTYRSLVQTQTGGWLIDTPGMRELQLADMAEGIQEVFDDLLELSAQCKFRNCDHVSEPGCAVQAAIADGTLDPARLERWRKLQAEDARNTESIARQRARGKAFAKMVKGAKKAKRVR
ncbi:ribosome small subunit-dependent GTPase A [Pacificoceanicola onchidii]|uniref:ribosome small subunit-dependent GTPase A n=1 Tax=Pacificoceanicola onchidii TaxID=2562685 RepID=UPI0010A4BD65|nr:ribosome small subunit-dependent GTPase A [Pacificoceanicola onchidii]